MRAYNVNEIDPRRLDLKRIGPLSMRGKNVDYLESKNKSPLMKNKSINAYFS